MTRYDCGMVVAAQPEAVEAGASILRAGGNAVDAAIACGFVAGVVDTQKSVSYTHLPLPTSDLV